MKNIIHTCNNLGITNLQPVRKGTNGVSKFGSTVFCGQLDSNKVKVTSYQSSDQINILNYVRENNVYECAFPKIIAVEDNLIVEKWIIGRHIDEVDKISQLKYAKIIFKFMQQCKQTNITSFSTSSFDYLLSLESRLAPYDHKEVHQFLDKWKSQRDLIQIEPLLSHNDLSNRNIIIDNQDKLYLIDHELFGVSRGWFLTWKNSYLSRLYNHALPEDRFYDSIPPDFVDITWRLRKIGSHLRSGRIEKAIKLCNP